MKKKDLKYNNNVVVSGHHLTSSAAKEVLNAGGNAFDAAIAAFFMAWVVEPTMAGAGGGGFANIYTKEKQSFLLDFFCQTPMKKRLESSLDFYPIEIDFGDQKEIFHIGAGSVATPGNVAGIFELHRRLGTVPIHELASQAINVAKIGFLVTPFQARIYKLTEIMLKKSFLTDNPYFSNSKLVQEDDKMVFSKKADFLDYLTRKGRDVFYKGEVSQNFIANQLQNGGNLTMKDMEQYQVEWRETMKIPFINHHILVNPLPSLGGASIAVLSHYFKKVNHHKTTAFSTEHLQLLLDIQKKAMKIPKLEEDLTQFLKKSHSNKLGSTTHFGVTDRWGNAIGITTSIGEGAGLQMPNTEILLNNMLGEAALLPNGFHSWKEHTRLGSMMTPSIVIDEKNNPVLVTGSSGAGRIPMAIFSVILNKIAFKTSLNQAVNGPRAHFSKEIINIEPNFDISNTFVQENWQIWKENSMFFGGANSIAGDGDAWIGVIDNRREGLVL